MRIELKFMVKLIVRLIVRNIVKLRRVSSNFTGFLAPPGHKAATRGDTTQVFPHQ